MTFMPWLALMLLLGLGACGRGSNDVVAAPRGHTPGMRTTRIALQQTGGVLPGWQFSPPPGDVEAGRQAFADFGCQVCHQVGREPSSTTTIATHPGPNLTGMGAHVPPAYFAESIVNPDAILIEGPGYIAPGGHSTMPDYPEMTVRQLGDLVAYLVSLNTEAAHVRHVPPAPPAIPSNVSARPALPAASARAYFVQSYDVRPDRLAAFEAWWRSDGARRFLAFDGLLTVETFADYTRAEKLLTSIFGFRDAEALKAFMSSHDSERLGLEFDAFIGPHDHTTYLWSPIYRVPSLSAPQ